MAQRNSRPYGFAYQAAVIEAAELMALKFGPMMVLQCLVKHCNADTGKAYPSKATLATLGGQGLRTVKRHLRTLERVEIIKPLAYETGGYARATVYGFGLPMWAQPQCEIYSAKMAWLGLEREKYGANLSSYRAILSSYRANLAHQQERKEIEKGAETVAASRGAGPADASGVCPESGRSDRPPAFRKWDGKENYSQYLSEREAFEREALRAAEKREGGEAAPGEATDGPSPQPRKEPT